VSAEREAVPADPDFLEMLQRIRKKSKVFFENLLQFPKKVL
jgi:hypothetical protein